MALLNTDPRQAGPSGKAGTRRIAQRLAAAALALALAVPAAVVDHRAARAQAPESIPDLAESLLDAVVNISTAQNVTAQRSVPLPQVPEGSPFQEFFDEFFNRQNRDNARPRRVQSLGSGFVIDGEQGIIVTNNHVIEGADEITANFNDGSKLVAEVIGRDSKTDIAVLKVTSPTPLKAVSFGDSRALRVGEWVMAIGNPFGLGGTVTTGIVSARNRNINSGPYDNYIQTDASINRGNSGGPLFNRNGEVIGINTAILSPTGGSVGIGFAVPSSLATPIIDQLKEYGETRRGWLGVRIQSVDDATAEALNLGTARGALIAGIDDKGPARPGGLEVGDVITKFDGKDVKDSRDLPRIVAATPVGKDVPVTIVRKGQESVKTIKLGRLEDSEKPQVASATGKPEPAKPAVTSALGLELSAQSEDLRKRYSIKEGLKGVVITRVDPNSNAADRRISVGEMIVEVGQEPVESPADVTKRLEALRKEGRKSALLLVSNNQGEVRFVAVTMN